MRLLITADLHFNHPRSRPLAIELIEQMNRAGGDALLVIGDTSVADGDSLEQCLGLFEMSGPKLFVAGNHELWTNRADSFDIFTRELPQRVQAMEWTWLESAPFVHGSIAIVGSIGWYDYSFAQLALQIPRRFYERKVSPGAALRLSEHADLLLQQDDIPAHAMEIVARWNDGTRIRLGRSDDAFLEIVLANLEANLRAVESAQEVLVATHHLPFAELLPPAHSAQWDFAKAYLGSAKIGQLILRFPNVRHLWCGHSHFPAQAQIGAIRAVNVGSGYRHKVFHSLDLPD